MTFANKIYRVFCFFFFFLTAYANRSFCCVCAFGHRDPRFYYFFFFEINQIVRRVLARIGVRVYHTNYAADNINYTAAVLLLNRKQDRRVNIAAVRLNYYDNNCDYTRF